MVYGFSPGSLNPKLGVRGVGWSGGAGQQGWGGVGVGGWGGVGWGGVCMDVSSLHNTPQILTVTQSLGALSWRSTRNSKPQNPIKP